MSEEVTLSVLSEKLNNIRGLLEDLKETNASEHREIRDHVATTNGKVAENTKWRYYFMGAGAMIGFLWTLLTFIIPLLEK